MPTTASWREALCPLGLSYHLQRGFNGSVFLGKGLLPLDPPGIAVARTSRGPREAPVSAAQVGVVTKAVTLTLSREIILCQNLNSLLSISDPIVLSLSKIIESLRSRSTPGTNCLPGLTFK